MQFLDYNGLSHYDEKIKDFINSVSDNIQVDSLPTPSAQNNGMIVQYVGTTTGNVTNGYFYKSDGTAWNQIDVQPSSASGSVIDDTTVSTAKAYSSSKTTELLSNKLDKDINRYYYSENILVTHWYYNSGTNCL